VAALWAAWPFFNLGKPRAKNLKHPVPKTYNGRASDLFEDLHQLLRESAYRFGDRWSIVSADTQTNRIVATLQFTEEEQQVRLHGFEWHYYPKNMRRLLKLEAHFIDKPDGQAIVEIDFETRIEGFDWHACDHFMEEVLESFENRVGAPLNYVPPQELVAFPAPPWWLLGITVTGILVFACDMFTEVNPVIGGVAGVFLRGGIYFVGFTVACELVSEAYKDYVRSR